MVNHFDFDKPERAVFSLLGQRHDDKPPDNSLTAGKKRINK